MAEAKVKPHDDSTTDRAHPAKKAKDAYGGDPLDPNDAVLERVAKAVKGGKEDELVNRWADAVEALFTEANQPNTPKRILLSKIAKCVNGDADEATEKEVDEWAGGGEKAKQAKKSDHNLDHLQ